ncbi:hypothetical protein [Dyella psychrodurans]|uniref:Uncharacterized protein n=1 Tax=Dyella psychrodurans TaxID=1927960 RepID=A0A370X7F5_9GAMM|nr:hypothetical protein [Dyella psychrodurans]RDS84252.1 hypothetical protein DWU99_10945 [Dyella psychrodurans]
MKVPSFPIVKKASLLLSVPAVLLLAGCQGTLHNRWVNEADSYDRWSPQMADMPIDVHGTIPGTTHADTVARVPQGTTATRYAAKNPQALGLESLPRVVLYVGGDRMPTNASYCSAAPVLKTADNDRGDVMVASALCDGPRLVVRSRREVKADDLSSVQIASTLNSVKSRLLFGLTISPAQTPDEEY